MYLKRNKKMMPYKKEKQCEWWLNRSMIHVYHYKYNICFYVWNYTHCQLSLFFLFLNFYLPISSYLSEASHEEDTNSVKSKTYNSFSFFDKTIHYFSIDLAHQNKLPIVISILIFIIWKRPVLNICTYHFQSFNVYI